MYSPNKFTYKPIELDSPKKDITEDKENINPETLNRIDKQNKVQYEESMIITQKITLGEIMEALRQRGM